MHIVNFSEKIMMVEPSVTLAITSKAKAMLKEGKDVIILAAGEPDFDTPEVIKESAIKAIQAGFTKYTPAAGTVSLKEAICNKLKNDNGLEYKPANIVVSCGAKHSLYNLFQVVCTPGDEVLIIAPFWLSYPEMVKLAGGKPVIVQTKKENNFKVTPEEISSKITPKTKVIILNSPSNPAGVVYDKRDLEKIAEICVKNNILMVSDEIYEKILFDGKEHISIASVSPEAKENTVIVNGVSKSYSMTGWRIGYISASEEIVKKVSTLQSHSTSNPCSISQVAAETALKADLNEELVKNSKMFQERRDLLLKEFEGEERIVPLKPSGAFYLFCDISKTGLDSVTFANKLLEEEKTAVIPGKPFGADGYIRISFATDMDTLKKGTERIKKWINKL